MGRLPVPSFSARSDLRPGWPMVVSQFRLDPHDLTLLPKARQMGTFADPGQAPERRHSRCWQGSPQWISGSSLCKISRVWPSLSCRNSNRQGQGELGAFAVYQMTSPSAWLPPSCPAPSTAQAPRVSWNLDHRAPSALQSTSPAWTWFLRLFIHSKTIS